MNRVARWLAVLAALLATSACMDTHLHCEVPGGDVNILGRQKQWIAVGSYHNLVRPNHLPSQRSGRLARRVLLEKLS